MDTWEALNSASERHNALVWGDETYELQASVAISGAGDGRIATPAWVIFVTSDNENGDTPVYLKLAPAELVDSLDYDHDDPDECQGYQTDKDKKKEKIEKALASLEEKGSARFDFDAVGVTVDSARNVTRVSLESVQFDGTSSTLTANLSSAELGKQLLLDMARSLGYTWA